MTAQKFTPSVHYPSIRSPALSLICCTLKHGLGVNISKGGVEEEEDELKCSKKTWYFIDIYFVLEIVCFCLFFVRGSVITCRGLPGY